MRRRPSRPQQHRDDASSALTTSIHRGMLATHHRQVTATARRIGSSTGSPFRLRTRNGNCARRSERSLNTTYKNLLSRQRLLRSLSQVQYTRISKSPMCSPHGTCLEGCARFTPRKQDYNHTAALRALNYKYGPPRSAARREHAAASQQGPSLLTQQERLLLPGPRFLAPLQHALTSLCMCDRHPTHALHACSQHSRAPHATSGCAASGGVGQTSSCSQHEARPRSRHLAVTGRKLRTRCTPTPL